MSNSATRAGESGQPSVPAVVAFAWITVSERLPDEYVCVLMYGIADNGMPMAVDMAWITADGWHFYEARHGDGCDPNLDKHVTHWMPLPAPPTTATPAQVVPLPGATKPDEQKGTQ